MWAINNIDIESFDNVSSAVVLTNIKQNPVARVDKSGSATFQYKERTSDFAFTLKHNGSSWRVVRLQVAK